MNTQSSNIKSSTVFSLKPVPTIPGLAIRSGIEILNDTNIVIPPEVVHDLIHRGTKCVLAGVSKASKTQTALGMAISVATGTDFLGFKTTQGDVLYANFEIPEPFIKERLLDLTRRRWMSEPRGLEFLNLRGKTTDPEALIAQIIRLAEGKHYSLIIIDPIYKLMGGRSENSSGSAGKLCNLLDQLAERTGAAIVCLHHFPKGNAKKKAAIDRMAGSGVFARDADTMILLTEHTEPDCFTVEMILRNFPPQAAFVVERQYPAMVVREDLDPEDIAMDSTEDVDSDEGLMELLKVCPLPAREFEFKAIALGLSRRTYYRVKAKLKDEGYIRFDEETKTWSLVNTTGAVPFGQNGTGTGELNEAGDGGEL